MERKRTLDIIISAVIAIILWFYLINIVNPQKTAVIKYVPVHINGQEALEERGLAVAGDLQYIVNLTIVGARNDISQLTANDFTATADIASLNKGLDYIKVQVVAPRGIAIEDIDTDNIEVAVEDFVSVEKTVRLHFVDEKPGTETTVLKRSNDKIYVKGAKSDVDKVAYMYFDLPSTMLEEDVVKSVLLLGKPVDTDYVEVGGIEVVTKEITVDAAIYQTKVVSLKTDIVGEPLMGELAIANYDIDSVVTIKGDSKLLSGISHIDANPIIIDGINETTSYKLEPIYPEGIYPSRNQEELKATIYIDNTLVKEEQSEETSSDAAISIEGQN